MNPELVPPSEGVHTAKIYNYKNVPDSYRPLWKALYYLEGGEGYPKVASVWDSVYHYDPVRICSCYNADEPLLYVKTVIGKRDEG